MGQPDFSELISGSIAKVVALGGGRNSQVCKLTLVDGRCLVGKAYYQSKTDVRDRLGVEFQAFSFLHKHDVSCVPHAIAFDAENQLGLYEYIEGEAVVGISSEDVQGAVAFTGQLKKVSEEGRGSRIGPASAACFSVLDIWKIIEQRLQGLLAVSMLNAPPLHDYLRQEIMVFFELLKADVGEHEQKSRCTPILSPSDFGFHNCIRRENGNLVFVDFEYFGFDDPAKLIADFLLHPGMDLSKDMKVEFLHGVLDLWPEGAELQQRVRLYYPFIGLVWCLICLNEFLEDDSGRRCFAGASSGGDDRLAQLEKSKIMLSQIKEAYENYPY